MHKFRNTFKGHNTAQLLLLSSPNNLKNWVLPKHPEIELSIPYCSWEILNNVTSQLVEFRVMSLPVKSSILGGETKGFCYHFLPNYLWDMSQWKLENLYKFNATIFPHEFTFILDKYIPINIIHEDTCNGLIWVQKWWNLMIKDLTFTSNEWIKNEEKNIPLLFLLTEEFLAKYQSLMFVKMAFFKQTQNCGICLIRVHRFLMLIRLA